VDFFDQSVGVIGGELFAAVGVDHFDGAQVGVVFGGGDLPVCIAVR